MHQDIHGIRKCTNIHAKLNFILVLSVAINRKK